MKKIFKSDSICQIYAQMKKSPVFIDSQRTYTVGGKFTHISQGSAATDLRWGGRLKSTSS